MASTQSISASPFPPARRLRWPRCRLVRALRSTSSSRLEAMPPLSSKVPRLVLALVVMFPLAPAHAQHASDDPVGTASDAFGLTLGLEKIGLYSAGLIRGFNPGRAAGASLHCARAANVSN